MTRDGRRRCASVNQYPEVSSKFAAVDVVDQPDSPDEVQFQFQMYWKFVLHQDFSDMYSQ